MRNNIRVIPWALAHVIGNNMKVRERENPSHTCKIKVIDYEHA